MAGRSKSKGKKRSKGKFNSRRKTRAQAARTVKRAADDLAHAGERAAAGMEHQVDETATVARDQLKRAAASTKPAADVMARTGQQYVAWTSQLARGSLKFAGERYRHNLEFARSLALCRQWSEAISLQQNWALQAVEDYMGQAAELTRAAASAGFGRWQPVLPAD